MARLARDGLELDDAVDDLRDLELEQPLHQAGVRARHDDLRALGGLAHLDDVGLEPAAVVVVLVLHLLGLREQGLDLAEVEQGVAGVGLLDDPGDDVALAAAYSSYFISRSASRMRWKMTCLAVCAAMRPKSSACRPTRG